jgi:hypothetical protein
VPIDRAAPRRPPGDQDQQTFSFVRASAETEPVMKLLRLPRGQGNEIRLGEGSRERAGRYCQSS